MSGKRVTMQQVAERAGVSRTTVSFVLNNTPNVNISPETRERIIQAATDLNYARDFAATSLATGRSHTIALVMRQDLEELSVDAFLGGLINGISRAINTDGYHLLFYAMRLDAPEGAYGELIRSQRVDGLLLSGPVVNDPELLELHDSGVPIVVHGTPALNHFFSVDVDNVASARSATEHLILLGHRRIALITNGPLTYTASRDRYQGYCQALGAAGIELDNSLVAIGAFTDDSGYNATLQLLSLSPRPTAIFVASDVVALGAMRALKQHGLDIPNDLSIIGFDDIPLVKYLDPGLTTIRLPAIDLGFYAGQMLMRLIKGEPIQKRRIQLTSRLIIRDSTAPYMA
jgi:DNA-binding LacI/PurR family transcriptional regulator